MVQAPQKVIWTIEDIEALPENPAIRYEIIAGNLLMTRSPHYRHQQIIVQLCTALNNWSLESGLGTTIISPGIVYSKSDSVIPDLVWVSHERLKEIEDEGIAKGIPYLLFGRKFKCCWHFDFITI